MTNNHPKTEKFTLWEILCLIKFSDDWLMFRAVPGGSLLNASDSLGRIGIDVELISEFGTDMAGDQIANFLSINLVKTKFSSRHPNHSTSLSLAFLDKNKNASNSFYHDLLEEMSDLETPEFQKDDILLFGSFYAIKPNRRNVCTQTPSKSH